MATTFRVSPVDRVGSALPSTTVEQSLSARGIVGFEAASRGASSLVDTGDGFHPLLSAMHRAFCDHRPLVLSPDHVWLCVAQAVGRHIDARAEALRHQFVAHEGRRVLEVRRDEFIPGSPDNDWAGVVATFDDALREILGPRGHGIFCAGSSTTDAATRTASSIVMMGAVQQYFDFRVSSLCGIPELTLEGTPQDWTALRERVDLLEDLGLDWWLPMLRVLLQQFEAAAHGRTGRRPRPWPP